MFRKTTVGSQIDSFCGKCKMVLNHMITAMVEDQPKRVRCLTCSSEHNHRGIPSIGKPRTSDNSGSTVSSSGSSASRSKGSTSKAVAGARWQALVSGWDESSAKAYTVYERFAVNDFVTHSTFGRGVVVETPTPDRMIALFQSGEKMLMQAKQRS